MANINEQINPVTFHIISHTHWDREWYLPFETFRVELVELIDDLLNILEQNDDFIFHLDGQTIILQDYLEIRPYKKEQIIKFIKSGNLQIGPWHVLSDQFLTSGEATIRNLLFGIKDSKDFGNVMKIGYCPDQFGQIAQLPQILKGFDISSVIVGRGIQDSKEEHLWFGLNGTNVLAISLTHWYNNAQRLPEDKDNLNKYLNKIYDTQLNTSISKNILLMNGCDHLTVQKNLPQILKSMNGDGRQEKWKIKHDSLSEVVSLIDGSPIKTQYPIYFGELRDDNNKYILAGTLSSRVYLKLLNYRCQTKLEKIVEPLATLLAINNIAAYDLDYINYAWRLLIQNHAHDSICGCSIDAVHKEMEIRFLKVEQVIDKLKDNLLAGLKRQTSTSSQYLQLINMTNYHRDETVEVDLEFPLGPIAEHASATPTVNISEIKNLKLMYNDNVIGSEIIDNKNTYKMIRSKDEVPLLQAIQTIKILVKADIEPYSIKSYEITKENITKKNQTMLSQNLSFENLYYSLSLNQDGTLSISNTQFNFQNIHFLTMEDDLGDEYNFVPNTSAQIISSINYKCNIRKFEENQLRTKFSLDLKNMPDIEYNSEITCYKDSGRIEFKTKIINKCKNKRIRLHFPTNLNTNQVSCDTPFGVILRARPPITWTNYATSQPIHNWISHSNDDSGLAFFGGGLADYELYENGNGFAVTLIRAVGKLSTVKSHSLIETPEAQCNREIEFHYAIHPHSGNWKDCNIEEEQLKYQSPVMFTQSNSNINLLKQIQVSSNPSIVISSLKCSESNRKLYILRLYNPHNKSIQGCSLNFKFQIKRAHLLNLNEDIQNNYPLDKNSKSINFEIKPYQILTFGFEL